jgi:hypothetical protein
MTTSRMAEAARHVALVGRVRLVLSMSAMEAGRVYDLDQSNSLCDVILPLRVAAGPASSARGMRKDFG